MATAFQEKVYAVVSKIPYGYVATYKSIARAIGCRSCRAVGQALKKNPHAPDIPCHRVIASNLRIGGFRGYTAGYAIKQKWELLAEEGVKFQNGRLIDRTCVFNFYSE